jgi:hypothetical protein
VRELVARGAAVGRRAAVGRCAFEGGGADEYTGVTGAGGRRGALCGGCGAENITAGGGPAGVGLVGVGAALLNAAGAGGPLGRVVVGCAGLGCENGAAGAGPVGAVTGAAGCGAWLNVGAPLVPAGADSGVCVVGALLKATGAVGDGRVAGRGVPGRLPGREIGRAVLVGAPLLAVVAARWRAVVAVRAARLPAPMTPAAAPKVLNMTYACRSCPTSPRPWLCRPMGLRTNCFISTGSLISSHSIVRQTSTPSKPFALAGTPSRARPLGVRNTRIVASTITACASCRPRQANKARHQV